MLVQREVSDVLRPEVDAHVRLVCLQQRRFRRHRDRLGQRTELQLPVDANDTADGDRDVRLDELLESLASPWDGFPPGRFEPYTHPFRQSPCSVRARFPHW